MQKIVIALISLFITANLSAQEMNQVIFDENAEEDILYGYCTLDALNESPFVDWFTPVYQDYPIDEATLNNIDTEKLNKLRVTLVIGTWCGDSQEQVPAFVKILDKLGYDYENLTMICVNKLKTAEGTDTETLNIEKVPTFIFFMRDKEIGRIIETPAESLEKDIANIVSPG